jgi:hypothetical protein
MTIVVKVLSIELSHPGLTTLIIRKSEVWDAIVAAAGDGPQLRRARVRQWLRTRIAEWAGSVFWELADVEFDGLGKPFALRRS